MRRALLTRGSADPLTIGAMVDFATIPQTIPPVFGLGPNTASPRYFFVCYDQPGQDVRASGAGLITTITILREISGGKDVQFVAGTIAGNSFTITNLTPEINSSTSSGHLDTFSVSLAVASGQFLGVICPNTGGTIGQHVAYLDDVGSSYRWSDPTNYAAVPAVPVVADTIPLLSGSVADRLLLIRGDG